MTIYNHVVGVKNEEFRVGWTNEALKKARLTSSQTVLDVGAGEGRFRGEIESLGYQYFSHDFGEFIPTAEAPGLQDKEWNYVNTHFRCDILDIPETSTFDIVLCTEVLEHVPDPVETLRKLIRLTAPGGRMIITVPFLSLMHQAPFWFSSGLSPFWFDYWRQRFHLRHIELTVFGDYADLFAQEAFRAFWPKYRPNRFRKALALVARRTLANPDRYRDSLPKNILTSGAFGVCFVAEKDMSNEP